MFATILTILILIANACYIISVIGISLKEYRAEKAHNSTGNMNGVLSTRLSTIIMAIFIELMFVRILIGR